MTNDEQLAEALAKVISTRSEIEAKEPKISPDQLLKHVQLLNSMRAEGRKLMAWKDFPENQLHEAQLFTTDGKRVFAYPVGTWISFHVRLEDIFAAVPIKFPLEIKDSKEAGEGEAGV